MKYSHYKEEHIRGLNILHLVKKLSGISETEINLDDLDLESFFAREKLGGLPFWAEVSKKTEEGYLLQSLSDVCRLFSELSEGDENQENEKKPKENSGAPPAFANKLSVQKPKEQPCASHDNRGTLTVSSARQGFVSFQRRN